MWFITYDFDNLPAQSFQSMKTEEPARFKAAHFGAYYQVRKAERQNFHFCADSSTRISFYDTVACHALLHVWVCITGILLTTRTDNAKSAQGTAKCAATAYHHYKL